MQKILIFLSALIGFWASAVAQDEETPASPRSRTPPPFPAACLPPPGVELAPQTVTLMFDVDDEGTVQNVRVRESTDSCFEDVASSTARTWIYNPRLVSGSPKQQEDLEVTLTFVMNEDSVAEDFDARPSVRVPPEYPERCMGVADSEESVLVRFDVTAEGVTQNIEVVESTEKCLNKAATDSVKKWKYKPKLIGGEPAPRRGVETVITFRLSSGGWGNKPEMRMRVRTKLLKAQRLGKDEKTRAQALEILEGLQLEYGDTFTRVELTTFHHIRAIVRIQSGDYYGALDDLRLIQRLGMAEETAAGIAETIENLENALGIAPDAPPPPDEGDNAPDEDGDGPAEE